MIYIIKIIEKYNIYMDNYIVIYKNNIQMSSDKFIRNNNNYNNVKQSYQNKPNYQNKSNYPNKPNDSNNLNNQRTNNQYKPNNPNNNSNNNSNNQNRKNHQKTNYINNSNNEEYEIKSYLLDYLYNKIEVGEHKYIVIKNIADIYDLKSKKYYISANSCGINAMIIFLKKDGDYLSYLIDRRSISYNRQSLNKSGVRVTEIKLGIDLKLYDGTILDGIIIDSDSNIISNSDTKQNSTKMNFMVTDVFMLGGKSLITMDYKKKMYMCNLMFEKLISSNTNSNNIIINISKPYEMNEIKELFATDINNGIKNLNIKGITFYPQYSGTKLIYIFDKQDEKYKQELMERKGEINIIGQSNLCQENFEYSDKKRIFKFELVDPECLDDIILNLEMVKTETQDVYKLFGIFTGIQDKKTIFIKKNIGFAYIPTYILSIKFKLYFMNRESIVMSCVFNTQKNKWIPVDEAEVQKIDILNEEKRLKVTEQEIEIEDNEYIVNNEDE